MQKSLSSLTSALSAPSPCLRAEAAEHLAQLGSDAQSAALALVLACGDEEEEVRHSARTALELLGPPSAFDVDQLIGLTEARSVDVRYWAVTLLGRLRARAVSATDALARVVAGTSAAFLRQRAAWALGEIGHGAAAAVPSLQKAASEADPCLAGHATEALKKITAQPQYAGKRLGD